MFPQLDAWALAMQLPSALMGDSRLRAKDKTEAITQALGIACLEAGSHCHFIICAAFALGASAVTLTKFYCHIW